MSGGLPKGFWTTIRCKPCTEYEEGDQIFDGKDDLVMGIVCQDCGPVAAESFRWNTNRKAKIRRLCEGCYQKRREQKMAYIERHFGLAKHAAEEK